MRITHDVMLITTEAASRVSGLKSRVMPSSAPAYRVCTAWVSQASQGTRMPAANVKLRTFLAPTTDIRGVVVFDDGVSGSRKWRPPV